MVPAVEDPEKIWFWLHVQAEDNRQIDAPEVPRGVVAAAVNATPLVFKHVIEPLATTVQSPIIVSGA